MAAIDFPLTLPQNILVGYNDTQPQNAQASEMDTGPVKLRTRFTGVPRYITNARLVLTKAEKRIFRDFYELFSGTEFNWIDPDDTPPSACECRFLMGQPPMFDRIDPDRFIATFAFEILP